MEDSRRSSKQTAKTSSKRSTSSDKPQPRPTTSIKSRKSTQSRSKSRSTSRSRQVPAKAKVSLGAKVLTKKELAKKETSPVAAAAVEEKKAAKRSSRTASSQSKNEVSLSEIIADAQKSSSYNLRRRVSPQRDADVSTTTTRASTARSASAAARASASSSLRAPVFCQRVRAFLPNFRCCSFLNKCFESGYLRITLKQLFHILIASILLVVSLSIINHFNLFDMNLLKEKLRIDQFFNQVANLFKSSWTRVSGASSSGFNYLLNIPKSILGLFRK